MVWLFILLSQNIGARGNGGDDGVPQPGREARQRREVGAVLGSGVEEAAAAIINLFNDRELAEGNEA